MCGLVIITGHMRVSSFFPFIQWHKLTKSEQAVYYQMAQKEREKHMELYPGWSARDNYALRKNRKSKKPKLSTETGKPTEENASEPGQLVLTIAVLYRN